MRIPDSREEGERRPDYCRVDSVAPHPTQLTASDRSGNSNSASPHARPRWKRGEKKGEEES